VISERKARTVSSENSMSSGRSTARWTVLAVLEIGVVTVLVILDFFIPTLIILLLVAISLAVRKESPSTLGFHHSPGAAQMAATVLGLTALWDLFQIGLTMPILNRVTGERQDLSQFAGLQGNLGSLLIFLALSWTVAAVGEEIVYRGYLPTRTTDICGINTVGILTGVAFSSVLFALAHTEQGTIGVLSSPFSTRCSIASCAGTSKISGLPCLAMDSTTPLAW
jgi:uncharacterized protein